MIKTERSLRRGAVARRVSRVISLGISLGLTVALVGCSVLMSGPTPERTERPVIVVPEEAAAFDPEGSAEDNEPIFLQTLQTAAAHEGPFSSESLAQYFVEVGFEVHTMQVSQDRTRTDLEPESMFVSVRFDESCIVGQIVTDDRSFVAEVVPAVGPDGQLCLIGATAHLSE